MEDNKLGTKQTFIIEVSVVLLFISIISLIIPLIIKMRNNMNSDVLDFLAIIFIYLTWLHFCMWA